MLHSFHRSIFYFPDGISCIYSSIRRGGGREEGAQLARRVRVDQDTSSARVGQDVQPRARGLEDERGEEERRGVGHCQDGLTRSAE